MFFFLFLSYKWWKNIKGDYKHCLNIASCGMRQGKKNHWNVNKKYSTINDTFISLFHVIFSALQ